MLIALLYLQLNTPKQLQTREATCPKKVVYKHHNHFYMVKPKFIKNTL